MDLKWRKATRSDDKGGSCVELAAYSPAAVAVRDSKDPGGPILVVSRTALRKVCDKAS